MPLTQSQQAFIDKVTPYALDASRQTGIDPRVIIAQAALESAWGTAAPGNNYFGIKGQGQSLATTEYNAAGKPHGETASFRAYSSPAESFQSYADLMNGLSRYAPVRNGQGIAGQTAALGKSGYATDPQYGSLVAGIANQLPPISAQPPAPPPLPNLRSNALAFQNFDAAPPAMPRISPASQAINDALAPAPAAPPPPTQLASSWLPKSLQPGGQGFADNLGGGMSPLHDYKVFEDSTVPAGPFGTDALVRAAMSGDQNAVKKAMGDITGAAIGAIFSGKGSKDQITQQINDYLAGLATTAPGAARAIQAASLANPQLFSALAPDQQAQVKAALAALPPQATGQVAMPNLRPPMPPSAEPLVAGAQPDPLAPKPAAFQMPDFLKQQPQQDTGPNNFNIADAWLPPGIVTGSKANTAALNAPSSLPFAPGDNLDVRTDGEGNAAPSPYVPPAPNAAGLASLLGRGSPSASAPPSIGTLIPKAQGPDFGSFFDPQTPQQPSGPDFNYGFDPTMAMASPQSPQQMAANLQPPPPPPPFPSLASLNPTQMRGLEGPNTQGKINYSPLMAPGMPNFAGLPPGGIQTSPLFDIYAGLPNFGLPAPKPNMRPPAPVPTMASWRLPSTPRPQTPAAAAPPPPPPMSPQQAFIAANGPAPQNVNWAATLANDPFAQPGTQGTYVLQDLGSHGPATTPLQQGYQDTGQGDSYLNYPDFSWGY